MSLADITIGVIEGKRPLSDLTSKIKSLIVGDVVDPMVAFGEQFGSDFGKAALAEAAIYGPQIATDLATGQASQIPALIPVIATKLEQDGIKVAETDALQDANAIIGNALRVQGTAAQITANPTAQSPASSEVPPITPAATDTPTDTPPAA